MAMSVTAQRDTHWMRYYGAITEEQSTTSTTEVTLGTITIPMDSMGINGWCRITALWRSTGSNYSSTMRVKFGGNIVTRQVHTSGNQQYDFRPCFVWNQNATNAQDSGLLNANVHSTNNTVGSWAVDTTADVDVMFTGLVANVNRTLYLRFALVEVFENIEP